MKILMLVNWKIEYCSVPGEGKQPPDYFITGEPYWFYRYFKQPVEVEVVDVSSFPWLEHLEKESLRFYVWQTLRVLGRLSEYDLIVSHGMQSAVVLSLFRRVFHTRAKHVVFEIGSFNSAATSGAALKLMQFASKSIDGFIYHTSRQIEYYREYFPWIAEKTRFIPFGTDVVFFENESKNSKTELSEDVILCVGYAKRDWDTLLLAFRKLKKRYPDRRVKLRLIGKGAEEGAESAADTDVERMPYIPIDELKKEIQSALFCVVPLQDYNYSFGQMTLLQQMAMGKAVIAARVPSMLDYIEDGSSALFYESGNASSLEEQMERLLREDGFRERLGRQAAAYVKERHNEERMAEAVEAFFYEVADR